MKPIFHSEKEWSEFLGKKPDYPFSADLISCANCMFWFRFGKYPIKHTAAEWEEFSGLKAEEIKGYQMMEETLNGK